MKSDTHGTPAAAPLVIEGVRLDSQVIGGIRPGMPTLVFLHEGLGSIGLWRDFPARLAAATGLPALVYSRRGNGHSDPLAAPRDTHYMHHEARQVLPGLLSAAGIDTPILVGHSDGASIALIHAGTWPGAAKGVIAIAPHLFVECLTVDSIRGAKTTYESTDLRARMARHHADVDNTFYGWNDIWLHPDFLAWNIESIVEHVICPVLAVQGVDDEYGTMMQIDRLAELAPDVRLEKLADCRHSPHRDQPELLLTVCSTFVTHLIGERTHG